MPKISQKIDKITNSIVNRLSGESFATDVIELKKDELKNLKRGWKFDWNKEFSRGTVLKLVNIITVKIIGHIKEPKGIDFVVVPQTKPDKEADRKVSEFIRNDKLKRAAREAKFRKSSLSKKFDVLLEKLKQTEVAPG